MKFDDAQESSSHFQTQFDSQAKTKKKKTDTFDFSLI